MAGMILSVCVSLPVCLSMSISLRIGHLNPPSLLAISSSLWSSWFRVYDPEPWLISCTFSHPASFSILTTRLDSFGITRFFYLPSTLSHPKYPLSMSASIDMITNSSHVTVRISIVPYRYNAWSCSIKQPHLQRNIPITSKPPLRTTHRLLIETKPPPGHRLVQ